MNRANGIMLTAARSQPQNLRQNENRDRRLRRRPSAIEASDFNI